MFVSSLEKSLYQKCDLYKRQLVLYLFIQSQQSWHKSALKHLNNKLLTHETVSQLPAQAKISLCQVLLTWQESLGKFSHICALKIDLSQCVRDLAQILIAKRSISRPFLQQSHRHTQVCVFYLFIGLPFLYFKGNVIVLFFMGIAPQRPKLYELHHCAFICKFSYGSVYDCSLLHWLMQLFPFQFSQHYFYCTAQDKK